MAVSSRPGLASRPADELWPPEALLLVEQKQTSADRRGLRREGVWEAGRAELSVFLLIKVRKSLNERLIMRVLGRAVLD